LEWGYDTNKTPSNIFDADEKNSVYLHRSSVSNYRNYLKIWMKFQMLTILSPESKQ